MARLAEHTPKVLMDGKTGGPPWSSVTKEKEKVRAGGSGTSNQNPRPGLGDLPVDPSLHSSI